MFMSWEMICVLIYVVAKIINKEPFSWTSFLFIAWIIAPFKTILITIAGAVIWCIVWKIIDECRPVKKPVDQALPVATRSKRVRRV